MQPSLPQAATLDLSIDIQTSTYSSLVHLCLVQTSLFRHYFFQIQTLCFTFCLTIFFSAMTICRPLILALASQLPLVSLRVPEPIRMKFHFCDRDFEVREIHDGCLQKGPPRCTKKDLIQALANKLPALSSQTYGSYKSSSLVKQSAYPLPWSCLFLNIPNSDHTILPGQSRMSNILGSLRSFKFFKNRIKMGYIKLNRKH